MTSALEDNKPLDITEWLTLNTAASPSKLPIGQTPNAQNVWVDEKPGSVITAPGYRKVGAIPSGNPVTMCVNYFKASAGTETFVVSDNAKVWTTVDFQNFTEIISGLSSAFQLRGLVVRDKLWLTNGSDAVRVYDGSSVTVLDGTGGKPNVPKGRYIAYHDERVWLYHIPSNRSQLAFSALTDSGGTIIAPDNANAWPASNTLQISEGDADFGTGLLLYRGYLYMFKQYSIWRLIGYDEYTYTRVKCRASTGTRFNESLQVVDSLVHMIGIDGIYVFDGEEAERISDIIDPATASQSAFGFNTLQQPNSNNQFWQTSLTSDWNVGTKMTNVSVNDRLTIAPADDSKGDFDAGALRQNIDTATDPGKISLSYVAVGGNGPLLSVGKSASLFGFDYTTGSANYLTDGNSSNYLIAASFADLRTMTITVDLGSAYAVGTVTMKNWQFWRGDNTLYYSASRIEVSSDGSNWTSVGNLTLPTPTYQGFYSGGAAFGSTGYITTLQDLTLSFAATSARYVRWYVTANKPYFRMTEFEVNRAGYQSSGKFVSKVLDYGNVPASYGNFNADTTANGETITYFTQSSTDGAVWDAEVAVTNGAAVGSSLKRYLRWGAYFNSSTGVSSPVIDAVTLATKYESVIHNTGGSIYAWGPFDASDTSLLGQTVKFYYRGAASSGGVSGASWNLIVSGGVLSIATSNTYIQFKIEILGGVKAAEPFVPSVTMNWVKGTGVEPQTLQNVASFFWRNRYWMAAASKGSASNDTILVRGKKTFKSPWQLKDWPILSFCRFQDGLYGGSSVDGSIYQLDTGYSKDGSAMDSYFQTGDFTFMGNHIHCHEVELEVERMGSYPLKFGISIDRGATWKEYDIDLTESTFAPSYWKKLFVDPGTTPIIRFRVRTNGVDQPFQVHNLRAYYEVRQSRGSLR